MHHVHNGACCSISSVVHVLKKNSKAHTNSNVGPVDAFLTRFFLDSHCLCADGMDRRIRESEGRKEKFNREANFKGLYSFGPGLIIISDDFYNYFLLFWGTDRTLPVDGVTAITPITISRIKNIGKGYNEANMRI